MALRSLLSMRCGALLGSIVVLAACGGGAGGQVTGLSGTLVLQNVGGEELVIKSDGPFTFTKMPLPGTPYNVTVRKQPLWQNCTVSQGSGVVSHSNPPDVRINCALAPAQVTTVAGTGAAGSVDGDASTASFAAPVGVVIRPDGGLLVSDLSSSLLRSVSVDGNVSTIAGGGPLGSVDGNGSNASFNFLTGLALDVAGNVYAADANGHRIRKITPNADVTTVAGNGTAGSLDGHGASATFNRPYGIARSPTGDIFALEHTGNVVRRITPAGNVTTVAGSGTAGSLDGTGINASFNLGYGIAADKAGNLYVADTRNYKIRKITPAGVVTTLAGSGLEGSQDGPGTSASFMFPTGITVDSDGHLYVVDGSSSLLRRVTAAGVVTTLAGQPNVAGAQDGIGAAATFNRPFGVAIGNDGALYIADTNNHKIRKVTPVRTP